MSKQVNAEYVPGNKKALAVLVGLVALLIAMPIAVSWVSKHVVAHDSGLITHTALSRQLVNATWILGTLNLVNAIVGLLLLYLGVKIFRTGTFPPVGLAVPFRMRVRTGTEAFINGGASCLFGAIFIFRAAAFVWYWPWKLL